MPSTVACIVITKNEERNIADCLASARWADELIVVDAESADKTVELARASGAKVFVRPWPGFGLQKNFGMAQASSDWILVLDADERVTEDLRDEVRACLGRWQPGAPLAYRIPRRNFFYGAWVRRAGVYPDYQVRLFRRGPLTITMSRCMRISLSRERSGPWPGTSTITRSGALRTISRSSASIPRWRHRRKPRGFGRSVGSIWSSAPGGFWQDLSVEAGIS